MAFSSAVVLRLSLLSALTVACGHEIGDPCTTSVDCSQAGERLCDITQPGGYCTVFNCEPGTCPEESVCIAFGASLSSEPACRDPNQFSRIHRTFCMASCSSNSDCRGGYDCVDLAQADHSWRNALLVDRGRSSKVCVIRATAPDSSRPETEVCRAFGSGGRGSFSAGGTASPGGAGGEGAGEESAGGSHGAGDG